jgi:DNA-binding XRE family transcriptional regulator
VASAASTRAAPTARILDGRRRERRIASGDLTDPLAAGVPVAPDLLQVPELACHASEDGTGREGRAVTMFSDLLRGDRERYGLTGEHAARRLGVTAAAYRALEAAEQWPEWETYDRIERLFGWPRTFVAGP